MDANRIKERYEKSIWKEEYFWIAVLGVFSFLSLVGKNLVLGIAGLVIIVLGSILYEFRDRLFSEHEEEGKTDNGDSKSLVLNIVEHEVIPDDVIEFGEIVNRVLDEDGVMQSVPSGKTAYLKPSALDHSFILGISRYGKTRMAYAVLAAIVDNFSEEDVKIAISDAKEVSFTIFEKSKHLYAPIAKDQESTERLIELLLEEMNTRFALFDEFKENICTTVDEYYDLSGIKLPRIVAFFDEIADSVEHRSDAEVNLRSIAKKALASGINLIFITQRPTNISVDNEVTSQCHTIMSTYMKNNTEYGSVSKIPKVVYKDMYPEKGLFMFFTPELAPKMMSVNSKYEGWGFVKSKYMDNATVERIAKNDRCENLNLPSLESSLPVWKGSEEDKLAAIEALEMKLGKIEIDDLIKYYGIGRRTAKDWLGKYNE